MAQEQPYWQFLQALYGLWMTQKDTKRPPKAPTNTAWLYSIPPYIPSLLYFKKVRKQPQTGPSILLWSLKSLHNSPNRPTPSHCIWFRAIVSFNSWFDSQLFWSQYNVITIGVDSANLFFCIHPSNEPCIGPTQGPKLITPNWNNLALKFQILNLQ